MYIMQNTMVVLWVLGTKIYIKDLDGKKFQKEKKRKEKIAS